jgi:AraC-like DNA-binding protein
MVFVLTAGSGRARHSEDIDVRAGEVYLVPAGVEHQPVDMADLEGWVVSFDPVLLRSLELPRAPGGPRVRGGAKPIPERSLFLRGLLRLRPGPARTQRIQRHVAEMEAELGDAPLGWENAAHAWLVLLVSELRRELQEHAPLLPPTSSGLVRDALTFIEAHCLEPLSLQDVSAALGRTPSHLANAVRRETGLTVGDWLREHRMVEARRLLLGSDASVELVADRVGYADVTHFIRVFRRVHGKTPRAWREERRPGS